MEYLLLLTRKGREAILKSNLLYNMKMFYRTLLLGGLLVLCGHSSVKQEKGNIDLLRQEFRFPNDSARTKLWWFHGETETTKEGITADLEAFKQAGVLGSGTWERSRCFPRFFERLVGETDFFGIRG